MAQLKATLVCKKRHEKPTTLEKLDVSGLLNVVTPKAQIRAQSCGARRAGREQCPLFRSKVTAGLQLLGTHGSEASKNDRWIRGED